MHAGMSTRAAPRTARTATGAGRARKRRGARWRTRESPSVLPRSVNPRRRQPENEAVPPWASLLREDEPALASVARTRTRAATRSSSKGEAPSAGAAATRRPAKGMDATSAAVGAAVVGSGRVHELQSASADPMVYTSVLDGDGVVGAAGTAGGRRAAMHAAAAMEPLQPSPAPASEPDGRACTDSVLDARRDAAGTAMGLPGGRRVGGASAITGDHARAQANVDAAPDRRLPATAGRTARATGANRMSRPGSTAWGDGLAGRSAVVTSPASANVDARTRQLLRNDSGDAPT